MSVRRWAIDLPVGQRPIPRSTLPLPRPRRRSTVSASPGGFGCAPIDRHPRGGRGEAVRSDRADRSRSAGTRRTPSPCTTPRFRAGISNCVPRPAAASSSSISAAATARSSTATPCRKPPLRSGDTIAIGQSVLMFTLPAAPTPSRRQRPDRARPAASRGRTPTCSSAIVRTVSPDLGSQILARPTAAGTDWLRTRLASLAALYETADAVSHILDVDQLLAKVMELVLRSVDADHGCFMLRNEDGTLIPKAVRYRDGVSQAEELAVSRTVVDHVLKREAGRAGVRRAGRRPVPRRSRACTSTTSARRSACR